MKKKRKNILIIISVILVLIGFFIFYKYLNIAIINSHIDMLDYKLLQTEEEIKNFITRDFKLMGGFGCRSYVSEEKGLELFLSGFPDATNKYVLTGLICSNIEYSIYNIHIGDDINKSIKILKNKGFIQIENNSIHSLKRNRVIIRLFDDGNSKIEKIEVHLHCTNIYKVQF